MSEEIFTYRYSAPTESERREIEDIRKKYERKPTETNKMGELRMLDGKVKNVPVVWSVCVGVVGTLVFGTGLSMVLEWNILLWGIVVMLVGCVPMALAYPLYQRILKRQKEKYGERILKLSEELLEKE